MKGIALLVFEVWAVRRWLAAFTVLGVFFWFGQTTEPFSSWPGTERLIAGLEPWVFLTSWLVFGVAHTRIAADPMGDHQPFLDALPIGRFSRWIARLSATALPPFILWFLTLAARLDAMSWGAETARPTASVVVLGISIGVQYLGAFGAGLLFGWFSSVGWGLFFSGLFGLLVVTAIAGEPQMNPLDGWQLYTWADHTPELVLRALPIPLTTAAAGLLGSLFLFVGPGDVVAASGSRASQALKLLLGAAGLSLLCCMGLGFTVGLLTEGERLTSTLGKPSSVLHREGLRIMVVGDEPEWLDEIEAIDAEVRDLVAGPEARRPTLDLLLGGNFAWYAGVYRNSTIRLAADADANTVAHELAHSWQHVAADGKGIWIADTLRFFTEGHASWVAQQVRPDPETARNEWAGAGAIVAMGDWSFDAFVGAIDADEIDKYAVYPLGYAFVDTLEQHHPGGSACIFREMQDARSLEHRSGLARFLVLSARCDMDVDALLVAFDEALKEHAPASIPKLKATYDGEDIVVEDLSGSSHKLACRFRHSATDSAKRLVQRPVNRGRCSVPSSFRTDVVEVQLGFEAAPQQVAFGEWLSLREN